MSWPTPLRPFLGFDLPEEGVRVTRLVWRDSIGRFRSHGEDLAGPVGPGPLSPPVREMEGYEQDIENLDSDEREEDAADAVNQHVTPQNRRRTKRLVGDAAEGQWHERDDDDRVEITADRIADCGVASRMTFSARAEAARG